MTKIADAPVDDRTEPAGSAQPEAFGVGVRPDRGRVVIVDSSGVHLLFKCGQRTDARFTVIDGPPAVSRVFDLAGAREFLPFETAP